MKILKYFSLLMVFTISVFAQVENAGKQPISVIPKFYEDELNFKSNLVDQTRLDIFVQVPYTEIQFIKSGDEFVANYTITVSVFDESKDKLIVEKVWNEKVSAKEFDQTISKNNFNLSLRSFMLRPNIYTIRTSVEDKDSRKNFAVEKKVEVRDLSSRVAISDLMLIAKKTVTEGSNKILPNVSKNVAAQKNGLPFFFEIYSKSPQNVVIENQLRDQKKDIIYSDSKKQSIDSGRTQIFHTIKDTNLSLGNYLITVNIRDSNQNILASVSKIFFSRWIGIPSSISDLEKAISEMLYIASSKELDNIKDAETKEEKVKRYLDFWKTKDPTPNTEDNPIFDEYYRRVAYANEHFSHYIEGWRTDRGMVFIILGAPNNVDRHPFDYDSKPYEVWEYYDLNRSFVFVDETGFGDYRLITPLTGDLYRFR